MATINSKFHFYDSIAKFNAAKTTGIPTTSIVFVDQPYVAAKGTEGEAGYEAAIPAQQFIYTNTKTFATSFDPATINAAIDALDGRLDTLEGGASVEGSVAYAVKALSDTIMGLLGNGFDTTNTVTKKVGDNASAIATLNGDNTTTGSVAKSIKDAIDALDFSEVDATATGEAIVKVSEANGVVSATKGDIAAAHVTVADSAEKFTATTVEAVLAEIDTAYKAAIAALGSGTAQGTSGQAIVSITETAGVVTATAGDIEAGHVTIADSGNKFTGSTVEAALQELGEGAKSYSFTKVTSGLDANVKEAYQLVETANGTSSNVSGALIPVYKDSALQSIKLLHATNDTKPTYSNGEWTDIADASQTEANLALCYAYLNVNGQTVIEAVPVGSFLRESEFKNGLQVSGGEVSVKKDSTSEDFLSISADGVKISGIADAISTAVNALDAEVTSTGGSKVTVAVTEVDGKITAVTVSESDIASDTALSSEITARKAVTGIDANSYSANSSTNYLKNASSLKDADEKLDAQIKTNADAISTLDGEAIKSIKVNNVDATVSSNAATVTIDGADIKLDGYTKGSDGTAVAATDTVNAAIGKLENQAANAESAAKTYADAITVNGQGQTSQDITIDGGDIALTGYTKGSSSAAVAAADTVNTAIGKLENQIDNLDSASPFEYATGKESSHSTILKGENLEAKNEGEVAIGFYNNSTTGDAASSKTAFSIGNGVSGTKHNAFEVRQDGSLWVNYGGNYVNLQSVLSNEIDWYYGA